MADVPWRTPTAALPPEDSAERRVGAEPHRVGWGFIALYASAYIGTCLVLIAPLLVTLALKVDSLVGSSSGAEQPGARHRGRRPGGHARQPVLRQAERPHARGRLGMRRPWMVIGLVGGSLGVLIVALAPSVPVVLVGWCVAQLFFNALLAALVAVLPDQVPRRSARHGRPASWASACPSRR